RLYHQSVTYQGSGCPPGSLNIHLDPTFNHPRIIIFQDVFLVRTTSSATTACVINLEFDYPAGWHYAVYKTTYFGGSVQLDTLVFAKQKSSYSFSGSLGHTEVSKLWIGPISDDIVFSHSFEESNLEWCTCNANTALIIENQLSVS
ncbi:hypothetical protein BDZ91DRAFT_616528, partial [Kalaharituber pfeilii]